MYTTYIVEFYQKQPNYTGNVGRPKMYEVFDTTKYGTAKDLGIRLAQEFKAVDTYGELSNMKIIRDYKVKNESMAIALESFIRYKLILLNEKAYVKNDRMYDYQLTKSILKMIDEEFEKNFKI